MSVAEKLQDPTEAAIESSWQELGYRIRPHRFKAFIRCEKPPEKTASGLLWLPPKQADFYGGLAHLRLVLATVMAVGAGMKRLRVGDRICFTRLFFVKHVVLQDGTLLGWVSENDVAGYPEF